MEPQPLSTGLELIPEVNVIDKERDALIISLLAQTISQQDPNPSSFMLAYNELLKKGLIKNRDAMFWYNRAKTLFTSQRTILNLPPNDQDFQINMMKMRYERDFIPIEKLGRGGFGHVMKCRKKIDHRLYAVKIIPVKSTCKRITEQLKTTLREVISLSLMDHKNVLRYYDAWIEPTWINQFTSNSLSSSNNNNNNNNNISKFNMKRGGRNQNYSEIENEENSKNNPMQIMNYPFNEDSEGLAKLNSIEDGNDDDDLEGENEEEEDEGEEEEEEEDDDDDYGIIKYNDSMNIDFDNSSRVEVLESTDTQSTTTTNTTNRSLTTTNISTADYMNNKMNDIIFEDSCSGSGNTTTSTSDNNNNNNNNSNSKAGSNNSVVFEDKKSFSKSNYGDDENEEGEDEVNESSKLDDNDNDDYDNDSVSTSSESSSSSGPPIEALNYKKNHQNEKSVIDIENEKKNINRNINTHKNPSPLLMPCDLLHFTNSKSPPFRQTNNSNGKTQNKRKDNTPGSDIIPYKSPICKLKFELSLYIQSEYCEGTTLGKYLSERMDKPNRKVNSIELYEFLIQIMEGLEHIHSKGIIHRDMKPENIFITNEKKIKIGDFGLATFNYSGIETSSDLSLVNPMNNINSQHSYGLGTQLYASPEQLSQSDYDFSTDIYSVGLIIVEMFANFGSMMERALTLKDVRKSVMNIPKNVLSYKPFHLLLPRMLDHNRFNRPKATEILTTLKVYYHSFITPQLTKEVKMIENITIKDGVGVVETKIEEEEQEIVVTVPNLLNIQKDINYDNCNKEELITLLVQRDLLIVEQQKRIFELEKKTKNKD